MTREKALAEATARLRGGKGGGDPGRDARLLLRWASGLSPASLTAELNTQQSAEEAARYQKAVSERVAGRPVSQIIGEREFWGHVFAVTPDVLDPRPETETLIAAALEQDPAGRILDLGVGSGCILLTLLAEWPYALGVGVDISAAALTIAQRNAATLGVADRVALIESDWVTHVDGNFDLIVSNPPYISEAEMAELSPSVRQYEPRQALSPGGDGLGAYRRIAAELGDALAPDGRLILEVGAGQAAAVEAIFEAQGFTPVMRHSDLDGRERCLSMRINHVSKA